jgi:hypothetical protein
MSGRKRTEVLCGLLAGGWGLVLLLGAYLQPYGDSRNPGPIGLHPGFTPIEYPYLIAFGVPHLGIAIGAIGDGSRSSVPMRLLLLGAAVALTGEAVISMASIGLALMPAAALGIVALVMSMGSEPRSAV